MNTFNLISLGLLIDNLLLVFGCVSCINRRAAFGKKHDQFNTHIFCIDLHYLLINLKCIFVNEYIRYFKSDFIFIFAWYHIGPNEGQNSIGLNDDLVLNNQQTIIKNNHNPIHLWQHITKRR